MNLFTELSWKLRRFAKGKLADFFYDPADSALAAGSGGKMPTLATATLSRLVFFARYMASSAR